MNDFINGLFEAFGGVMICFSIARILRDKKVAGVSLVPITFFTTWGVWNLYFYPVVGCWWSFWGGISVVGANAIWLALLFKYSRAKSPVVRHSTRLWKSIVDSQNRSKARVLAKKLMAEAEWREADVTCSMCEAEAHVKWAAVAELDKVPCPTCDNVDCLEETSPV